MSRLNKIIIVVIKLARQPEHLVGLSDLGSGLACFGINGITKIDWVFLGL